MHLANKKTLLEMANEVFQNPAAHEGRLPGIAMPGCTEGYARKCPLQSIIKETNLLARPTVNMVENKTDIYRVRYRFSHDYVTIVTPRHASCVDYDVISECYFGVY